MPLIIIAIILYVFFFIKKNEVKKVINDFNKNNPIKTNGEITINFYFCLGVLYFKQENYKKALDQFKIANEKIKSFEEIYIKIDNKYTNRIPIKKYVVFYLEISDILVKKQNGILCSMSECNNNYLTDHIEFLNIEYSENSKNIIGTLIALKESLETAKIGNDSNENISTIDNNMPYYKTSIITQEAISDKILNRCQRARRMSAIYNKERLIIKKETEEKTGEKVLDSKKKGFCIIL